MSDNQKKYASLSTLQTFLDNLKTTFSNLGHKHTISDITDYNVDSELSSTSTAPVQNKVLNAAFDEIAVSMREFDLALDGKANATHNHAISEVTNLQSSLDAKVPTSRTINDKPLSENVSLSASDVGALPADTVIPSIEGLATETYVNDTLTSKQDAITGIAGQFVVIGDDGKPTTYNLKDTIARQHYNCQEYGVHPTNPDNTAAMQNLINIVHENGGGIIWMPIGEYRFDGENSSIALNEDLQTCLIPKSGVSIIGESITGTVIKVYGNTQYGATWMANQVDTNSDEVALSGCIYQNFTIDMSEESMENYSSTGKAFGLKAIKNCVFRDLRLLNTPSTALGVDMLDNVVIDSVYVYRGGREWEYGGQGGAGIGIGTGRWEQENFIVKNCICAGCGHFGIFIEDQGIFNGNKRNWTMGQIITNNVVRNGRHYGIGVRGGQNVVITGNNVYRNKGGIYLDYGAQRVMVSNNAISENTENGLLFGTEDAGFGDYVCENVAVFGNSFFENKFGILTLRTPVNSKIKNNIYIGNDADALTEIVIDESKIRQGVFINDAGEVGSHEPSWLYDEFIDMNNTLVTYIGGAEGSESFGYKCPRIAIYDENHNFLKRINTPCTANEIRYVIEAALEDAGISESYRYIKFGDNCNGMIVTTMQLYSLDEFAALGDDPNFVTTVTNQIASKQDVITGTTGQFVVIGADGKPTTKTIPIAEEATF